MATEKAVTATVRLSDRVLTDVPVINPGDWFGKTWLLEIGGSYTPLYLVVEADSAGDAIDALADSYQYGPHIYVTGSDLSDYGTECTGCGNPGHPEGKHWQCEDGSIVTDPERGKYLSEPALCGNCCMPCDLDHLAVHGDDRNGFTAVTYDVPGYPVLVKPTDLEKVQEGVKARAEYEAEVSRPGKFEGCAAYVPYFWELYLNGGADEDDGTTLTFEVTEDDRVIFPELTGVDRVYLTEDDQGFVTELDGPLEQEDEQESECGPDEDDLTTEDHVTCYQYGKVAFVVPIGESLKDACEAWMEANGFYPALYLIDDHGGSTLIDLDDHTDPRED